MAEPALVSQLLVDQSPDGCIPFHPYHKWRGAHWALACLAELGHPPGDERLRPLLEQCYTWLLSKEHAQRIRTIAGRTRRCTSQEGNCVYYSLALGLADERTQELAERLMKWQWPDGGWNCDKRPEAAVSSFHETWIPLRALALYGRASGDPAAARAAERAADVFLKRQLFRRLRDGAVIEHTFVELFFPFYWHYNILAGLKVMSEAGFLSDPRCAPALDLLESKRLPDGGFPAEICFYRRTRPEVNGYSPVDWGGISKRRANPFITADAQRVLQMAER